jgi:hypothetical protein
MSSPKIIKDFIDGVETETNTEDCSGVIVTLSDGLTYQTYPYPGFGFIGNSCGLYIQKATPATDSPKKQIWFDIPSPEKGKDALVTKIAIEDRNSLSEDILKVFDDYISTYKNDKTPSEVLTELVGTDFKVLNKKGTEYRKVDTAPAAVEPEPVDETPETPESAPVERGQFYELTAIVGTDKVGSVDVLKLKKNEISIAPTQEKPKFTNDDPVINKDNFSKILCDKLKTTLKEYPAVGKQFNISESLVIAENMETDVNREREEASEANLEKAMNELKDLIIQLDTLDTKFKISENFRDFAGSIDHYKSLKDIGKYNTLGKMEPGMAMAINKKYGTSTEAGGMDREQRYNFYLAVSNNLKKLVNVLKHIAKPITKSLGGELEIEMNSIIKDDRRNEKYNRTYPLDYRQFHNKIIPYEFTASKIPVFKESSSYTGVYNDIGQKSKKFSSSVRKSYNNMNIGNATRKLYQGTGNAMSSGLKRLEGAVKNSRFFKSKKTEPDQMDARMAPLSGGKRKTRKIKARKTRRKVQKKRRQSKKH